MIVLTAIIIVTFSMWGGWRQRDPGEMISPTDPLVTMFGKTYSRQDVSKIITPLNQLLFQLQMYDLFGLQSVVSRKQDLERQMPYDLIANAITLKEAALAHGVAVSDEEAQAKLMTLQPFQENGQFSVERLKQFESNLGSYGMQTADVLEVVKASIAYEKLQNLIKSNYIASETEAEKAYQADQQTIKASKISFALADFKAKAEVKDEEISKYFEEKKETYKTLEKRALNYVVLEKPKPADNAKPEETQAKQQEFNKVANDFDAKFKEPGSDIAALVKEFQAKLPSLKLETAALFDKTTAPEALKSEQAVITAAFSTSLKVGSPSKPIDGTKGYYFLKVTQIEDPKQQELKDVKDKIKEVLVEQKANESMATAANDALKVLEEGIKAGKKVDELAKEKKYTIEALADFSPNNPPATLADAAEIAKEAGATAPGKLSKTIMTSTGVLIIAVNAKELRKREDSKSLRDGQLTAASSAAGEAMFKSWFGAERDKGKEQFHNLH